MDFEVPANEFYSKLDDLLNDDFDCNELFTVLNRSMYLEYEI